MLLRLSGASMIGELNCSGIGAPVLCETIKSVDELRKRVEQSNTNLLLGLREDEHSDWLLQATSADALLGRMSEPVELGPDTVGSCLLQPRFAVEQHKLDGSLELRAVDHFSWSDTENGRDSSVNGYTQVHEKLRHDTVDKLADAMCMFFDLMKVPPGLFKGDID